MTHLQTVRAVCVVYPLVFCGASAFLLLGAASFVSAQCGPDESPEYRQELVQTMNSPFFFRPLDHRIPRCQGSRELIHLAYAVSRLQTDGA